MSGLHEGPGRPQELLGRTPQRTEAPPPAMNPRLHVLFLVGALWVAGSMEVTFFHSAIFREPPPGLRIDSLWFPMPFFGLAGLLAGLGCGGRWIGGAAFGVAALMPGSLVPTATMGTQGAAGPAGLLFLTVGVPTVTYLIAGAVGGFASFRSWRGGLAVGLGFSAGTMLGPGIGRIAQQLTETSRLPVSWVVWALPWLTGSLGARRALKKRHR